MKITQEHQKQSNQLLMDIITKAWEDPAFKAALEKDPETTITRFSDNSFKLPENTRLVVEDQTNPSVVYLNIPRKVNFDDFELTDEQLEVVAGGELALSIAIGAGIATGFLAGVAIGISLANK